MRTYLSSLIPYGPSPSTGIPASASMSSSAQHIEYTTGYAVQANFFSGTPNGTLSISASNDGVNFAQITNGSFSISSSGTTIFNVLSANYEYVKASWVIASTASNGLVSVNISSKGF